MDRLGSVTRMYFINIRWCLNIFFCIGVHPQKCEIFTQKCTFVFNMALLVIFTYLISNSAIHDDGPPLYVITGALESLYLLMHAMVKLSAVGLKHREMISLLEDIASFWRVEDEPDADKAAENLRVLVHLKMIFYFYISSAAIPTIFITFRPFIMTERVLIFNSYTPTDYLMYYSAYVLEFYALWVIFGACVFFDVFFATSIVLAKVQFSLLNQEIKRTLEFRVESDEDRRDQQVRIKKCVDYHNFLLRYVDKINKSLSNVVLAYFGIFAFSECVQMFLLSNKPTSKEAFKISFYMASITNEFVAFYCIPSHFLTCEAEKTRDVAFASDCHENPSRMTKCFINMLALKGNKEVYIQAGKFVQLGMRSCLSIFQKIFSYYMFLRTIQEK